ncbi:hypothetical protein ACFSBZ_09795 [Amnibacterium flavum]|uniref:Uncharacterized protein n=1 Tax=Amnibacterium flavum TaxID=2173173 RepID=A0A2V1HX34_9MICO|nr:hypothetical protein [Amnibacterium flavum]PVZ95147.1 hypothetical protein DDQ50_01030 [Amnibacterium flavum]
MAAVMGLMLVIAVVSVGLLTATVAGSATSTANRANTQSLASADAGIDTMYASIAGGNYVCSVVSTTEPIFTAEAVYRNAAGNVMPCTNVVSGVPVAATVTSIGRASAPGVGATAGDDRAVIAELAIQSDTVGTALDKAVFSEGSFTLSNNVTIEESATGENDGDLYSNGTIYCKTQLEIQGNIVAQGNLSFENTCEGLGTIWVGGNATFSSSVNVKGSIFAAGNSTMTLANTSHVDGTIVTNGSIALDNHGGAKACPGTTSQWSICGSVVALGGSISSNNGASIGGSAYAKTNLTMSNANSAKIVGNDVVLEAGNLTGSNLSGTNIVGSVRANGSISVPAARIGNVGGSCQRAAGGGFAACSPAPSIPAPNPAVALPPNLGYPGSSPTLSAVNKPVREELPRIESSTTALTKWTGWTTKTFTGSSSCADAKTFLNGAWSGKTLVIVQGCSTPIRWNNETLRVKGDLAIMSTSGFEASNSFSVASSSTEVHDLLWIVPSDGPGISWAPVAGTSPVQTAPTCTAAGGTIALTNQTTVSGTKWFLYSPCTVKIDNRLNGFRGQIYAGNVTYPNNSAITMDKVEVPGATSGSAAPTTTTHAAQILSRVDVAGGS